MVANSKQVAGSHYGGGTYQHWDMVVEHKLNYFQGQITKYVMRAPLKNGKQDLQKAAHFLEKYLEVYDLIHPSEPVVSPFPMAAPGQDPEAWERRYSPAIDSEAYGSKHVLTQYPDPDFSIEGHNAQGQALYKCKHCGAENWAKGNYEAHLTHGSCAGRGYVAQG
jgi:hypothetical protein